MGPSFNEQFDQHGAWKRGFAQQLRQLADWMGAHELMDGAIEERLKRLEEQVRSDKVMVAFVAEFSRGKSELINAIFFADYGRRIMPASAGRTTMCPTELSYEEGSEPCLRLLPIETRLQPQGLAEWRLKQNQWTAIPLEIDNAQQMAQALAKVSEVRRVSIDEARALGFWHDDSPDDNPMADAGGKVDVPMWRHALINVPHPLLKQGLVILDTPGLNAVGAEPELTINLIPQAHAVVFILGADTGVTRSDLAIWREHLGASPENSETRLVVLNKIDALWDSLNSPTQVQEQLDRQCRDSADILGVSLSQVVPVSAQKGLVAKINCDDLLLEASGLPHLEEALGEGILGRRQSILRGIVSSGVAGLQAEAMRVMNIRRCDLDDQMSELNSLRGKNSTVIQAMRGRIEMEQRDFEASTAKVLALRSVHLKMMREVFHRLGSRALKAQMAPLAEALQGGGVLKMGLRKVYADTFARVRALLEAARDSGGEIHDMLSGTYRLLNAEFGFSLQVPKSPEFADYLEDISEIERRHEQYIGMGNTLRLAQPEFAQRLQRGLALRLRAVMDSASNELELWSKAATAQLDAQLRERKRGFSRRIEAVDRIQGAANGLVERIAEIEAVQEHLDELQMRLTAMTDRLVHMPPAPQERVAPSSGMVDLLIS
ncbi:dynamin family protein [Diaphorobacter ruginosibacter]|uniref:dynamin family protein n=1 Tax=Diaphorobacter ruginosibacter TaxID=1715720 RepID=UPI003341A333